jgi:hypothetical protein
MALDATEQIICTRQQDGVFDLKKVVYHTDRDLQYTSRSSVAISALTFLRR